MYLDAVIESRKAGKPTSELIELWQKDIRHTLNLTRFKGIDHELYRDLASFAMLTVLRHWKSFDPTKSDNPLAWFRQCILGAIIQELAHEKRNKSITRDNSLRGQLGINSLDKGAIIKSILKRMRDGYDSKTLLDTINYVQKAGLNFTEFEVIKKSLKNEIRTTN